MNSFRPLASQGDRPLVQNWFGSSWIEVFAVPVLTSIMEAQPVVLVLLCGTLFFTGKSNYPLLEEASISALLLSLYWWAMLIKYKLQPGIGEKAARLLHLPSLFATFAIIVGTHTAFLKNAVTIFLTIILVGWLWRRSISRVEVGLQEEQLIASFKVGFVVLLAILLFASFNGSPTYKILLHVLAFALPIFLVSGLLALSLRRLGALKSVYARGSFIDTQFNLTQTWLSVLVFLLVTVAIAATFLVVFAFQPLLILFSPLEDILRELYGWILSFLRPSQTKQLHHKIVKPVPDKSIHPHPQNIYLPNILLLLLILVILLLSLFILVMLFLFIRGILRKWKHTCITNEDEIRESLSIRSVLRERRQTRHRQSRVVLEQLDPASARKRYRELLQAMAWHKGDELGRRPDETPTEYQTRLLISVTISDHNKERLHGKPSDAVILEELTGAYILERYGGQHSDSDRRAYLLRWVPMLVKRLTSRKSKRITQQHHPTSIPPEQQT